MKAAGSPRAHGRAAKLISLAIIVLAVAVAVYVHRLGIRFPSTDAAAIDADVVHVASTVGGRIADIPVTENAKVSRGDLLFQIDPAPYRLAVAREYLLHQRVEHAKRILSDTKMPLAEVALAVGFCTQPHFSTVFKRVTGETPASWRSAGRTASMITPALPLTPGSAPAIVGSRPAVSTATLRQPTRQDPNDAGVCT